MRLAGGDSGRRAGHAAAPAHRARSPSRWSSGRPAVRRPSGRAAAAAGLNGIVYLLGRHLGEHGPRCLGRRQPLGRAATLRLRRAPGSRHRRRRAVGAAASWATAFLVLYGDSYLECDYAAVEAGVSRRAASGPDDRVPQRRPLGLAATCCSSTAASCATTSRPARPAMHHIDYGLGAFRPAAFANRRRGRGARSRARCTRICWQPTTGGLRSAPALLRDRLAGRAGRNPGLSGR